MFRRDAGRQNSRLERLGRCGKHPVPAGARSGTDEADHTKTETEMGIRVPGGHFRLGRSEEHTSELQSHSFISYAVFCLKKNKKRHQYPLSYPILIDAPPPTTARVT